MMLKVENQRKMVTDRIKAEIDHRLKIWRELKEYGDPAIVRSRILKEQRVYIGQRGIWTDMESN